MASSSSPTNESVAAVKDGVTFDGSERFAIPATPDVIDVMKPSHWRVPQLLILACSVWQLAQLWHGAPVSLFIFQTVCWRLAYNAGLGLILHLQSNGEQLTALVARVGARPGVGTRLMHILYPRIYDGYPLAFRAWLVFRSMVDLVLGMDVMSFFVLCMRCYEPVTGVLDVLAIVLGALLCCGAVWVKMDAHKVVGDYAWHWGDFFFRKECTLVFGGVFNMFPHPMYTVAYVWYYGLSFMTRSYTVAIVGALCHLSQIAFLVLVETPHMDKIYPSSDDEAAANKQEMTRRGYQKRREPIFLFNLDWTDASTYGLFIVIAYVIFFHMSALPLGVFVAHAVFWRLVYSGGLGLVLHQQMTHKVWTRAFVKAGKSHLEAFDHWKRLFNLVLSVCYTSFCLCALRLAIVPDVTSTQFWLLAVVSAGLLCLQYWASTSTWSSLGSVGYFYGDFFIEGVPLTVSYSGIYRYSNNPDSIIGYAGLYAVALLSQSLTMAFVAFFSQFCHFLFLRFVEMPHVRQLYGDNTREHGALWMAVHKGLSKAKVAVKGMQDPEERDRVVANLKESLKSNVVKFTRRAKRAIVDDVRAHVSRSLAELREISSFPRSQRRAEQARGDMSPEYSPSGGEDDDTIDEILTRVDHMAEEIDVLQQRLRLESATESESASTSASPLPPSASAVRHRTSANDKSSAAGARLDASNN